MVVPFPAGGTADIFARQGGEHCLGLKTCVLTAIMACSIAHSTWQVSLRHAAPLRLSQRAKPW